MDLNQNINQLMKEAQKIQQRMQEAEQQLSNLIVTGTAGAADKTVTVSMNGRHDVSRFKISPQLMQEPIEILEGLCAAAVNDAVRKIEKASRDKISQLTAGLNIPQDILKDKDED